MISRVTSTYLNLFPRYPAARQDTPRIRRGGQKKETIPPFHSTHLRFPQTSMSRKPVMYSRYVSAQGNVGKSPYQMFIATPPFGPSPRVYPRRRFFFFFLYVSIFNQMVSDLRLLSQLIYIRQYSAYF